MVKDGNLEVHTDKGNQENPMEREDIAEVLEVKTVQVILRIWYTNSDEAGRT